MQRKIDQFTTALCAMLVVGALLACKKRTPVDAIPSATSAAAEPATPAVVAPAASAAATADVKLGDVKRYADKEKAQTGAARTLQDAKVYNEADDKTAEVATLDKGLLVFRLASIPDWELVEFPSGVGKVSPGWVQAKLIDTKSDATVAREAVAAQPTPAVVKAAASAAPKSSASAKPATSASAKASASASAKPAASTLTAIPLNSATLNKAAQLAAQAAAQAKAAAAAAAAGGKAGK